LDQFSSIIVETWHSPSPRSPKWWVNPLFYLHFCYSIFMTPLTSFDDFTWIWWFFTFPNFFLLFFLTNFILICLDSWGLAIVILYFNFLHIMSCCGIFFKKYINSTWASIFYIIKNSSQLTRATYLVKNYENS